MCNVPQTMSYLFMYSFSVAHNSPPTYPTLSSFLLVFFFVLLGPREAIHITVLSSWKRLHFIFNTASRMIIIRCVHAGRACVSVFFSFCFKFFLINGWGSVVASLCNFHFPKVHSRKGLRSRFFISLFPHASFVFFFCHILRREVGLLQRRCVIMALHDSHHVNLRSVYKFLLCCQLSFVIAKVVWSKVTS